MQKKSRIISVTRKAPKTEFAAVNPVQTSQTPENTIAKNIKR